MVDARKEPAVTPQEDRQPHAHDLPKGRYLVRILKLLARRSALCCDCTVVALLANCPG